MKIKKISLLLLSALVIFCAAFSGCPDTPKTKYVTITFDSTGGSTVEPLKIEKGSSMGDKYPDDPTMANHGFLGWFNEEGTEVTAGTTIDKDITLKARWSANPCTVIFDSDGGSAVAAINEDFYYGQYLGNKYPTDPTKDDSFFGGWYTSKNYLTTELVTSGTRIYAENITLYARWLPAVTITFDTDGGNTITALKIGQGLSLGNHYITVIPAKTGFVFDGWYLSTDTAYENEYTKDTVINENITLKAKWLTSITVTFNSDGGRLVPSITIGQGTSMGDRYPVFMAKDEYSFGGWFDEATMGTQYTADTVINSNITLKAKWEIIEMPVNSWRGFSKSSGTTAILLPEYEGKSNVLKVITPTNDSQGNYFILGQQLAAGKAEITLSVDVWIGIEKPIAWQINGSDPNYEVIASTGKGSDGAEFANISEINNWVTVSGTKTVTISESSTERRLYLSTGQTGTNVELYLANLTLTIEYETPPPPEGIFLTIGQTKNLSSLVTITGTITWSSDKSTVATVTSTGDVTAVSFETGGSNLYRNGPATGTVTITATNGTDTQNFEVTTTTQGQESIMDLTPLMTSLASHFSLIGNIARREDASFNGTGITNPILNYHFNTLTAENDMKPQNITSGSTYANRTYNFTNSDRFVFSAVSSGHKVVGHTLMWHSQIPAWQRNMATAEPEIALAAMKQYITDVCTRYRGMIDTWDVLNEVFPDGGYTSDWKTSMRNENPWFKAIGSDFVYEGFLAARIADPDAKLYYNDYNLNNSSKATMVRNMVRDVNERYLKEYPNANRLLIEGIGMQSHHNSGVSAQSVRSTLNMFKALKGPDGQEGGVKISVSELDVLAMGWSDAVDQQENNHNNSPVTNQGLITQANQYKAYMEVYIEFKDIIERISIWGIQDSNSWRSHGLPLLFDSNGKAKPAYYGLLQALEQ